MTATHSGLSTPVTSSVRRFELDWLRVLAIILVFVFHSSRFFDPMDWHVKNATRYPNLQVAAMLVIVWMWYLELLFAYSLIFLPLFLWLKQGAGRKALVWLGDRLAAPGALYLLALPIMLLVALPDPGSFLGARNFGGWSALGYIPIFLNGFLLVAHDRLYDHRCAGCAGSRWPPRWG